MASYDFVNVAETLRDGVYEVPEYQRNYAWDRLQLRDLWDDVQSITIDPISEHYTGTIIVKKLQDIIKFGSRVPGSGVREV